MHTVRVSPEVGKFIENWRNKRFNWKFGSRLSPSSAVNYLLSTHPELKGEENETIKKRS